MSARDLWSAVALQAANDIHTEDYASVEYGEAVSFFMASGLWAESRQQIADCVGLHTDDLIRLGRTAIAERHLRDGPPAVVERMAVAPGTYEWGPAQPTRPEPREQCTVAPVVTKAVERDRNWWIRRFLAKQAA